MTSQYIKEWRDEMTRLNKNEVKLVRAMMVHLDENGDIGTIKELMSLMFGEANDEFDHTYSTLEHKLTQQTGKAYVDLSSNSRVLAG